MFRQPQRGRAAFTLVELLVVIAIIAMLIALLLPVVQAARESGRRTQCASNLRQLATACHVYHDNRGHLPTGGADVSSSITYVGGGTSGTPANPPNQAMGWIFQLLPYLEQSAMYTEPEAKIAPVNLPYLHCPSRTAPNLKLINTGRAPTDYAAAIPGARVPSNPSVSSFWNNGDSGGIICRNNPLGSGVVATFGSIPDGSSNTVMLGEKFISKNEVATGACPEGLGANGWKNGWLTGWSVSIIRETAFPPQHDSIRFDQPNPVSGANDANKNGLSAFKQAYMFGSRHPSGALAAMGDVSVKLVKFSIDGDVWWALGGRQDGLSASID